MVFENNVINMHCLAIAWNPALSLVTGELKER